MARVIRYLIILVLALHSASTSARAQEFPFTLLARVMEAGPRVTALAIDFGRDLPINWKLDKAFEVSAELLPLKTHAGRYRQQRVTPRTAHGAARIHECETGTW